MSLYKWFFDIVAYLFPDHCLGCGQEEQILCTGCENSLSAEKWQEENGNWQFLDKLYAAAKYKKGDLLARLLQDWKYERKISRESLLVKYFCKKIQQLENNFGSFGRNNLKITFIPMYPEKLAWRGFNQSEVLARVASTALAGTNLIDLLIKNRSTPAQMSLKAEERLINVKNVFAINKVQLEYLKAIPETIILVDDVATTGATLNEAAKVLKEAGVKTVIGLVLARDN